MGLKMTVFSNWFLASRPWSFTMTFVSISVGAALADIDGRFSWALYILTLASIVAIHAASNLMNDYYDVINGVDRPEVPTANYRPHPLMAGRLRPTQVRNVALLLFALSILSGIYLTVTRGWMVLVIGACGAAGGFLYTAPPLRYKYHALGEAAVFLMWGPLMVEGTYYVLCRTLSLNALWISFPFGVLVALVLLANNIRDIYYDRRMKIRTVPMLIGKQNGLRLYTALITAAYAAVLWMSLNGPLSLWSLLVLVSLPLAYRLMKQMMHGVPLDADARTAQLNTAFGALLLSSILLERLT